MRVTAIIATNSGFEMASMLLFFLAGYVQLRLVLLALLSRLL